MLMEVGLAIVALGVAFKLYQRPKNFPPGPRGLPLVGYVPFVTYHDPKYPFKAMMKLADTYGPVVGFYLGPSQPFISVCGYEAVKEILHNDNFNGRPEFKVPCVTDGIMRSNWGVMFAVGEAWQERRRFTLRHLRDLGFGKGSIEVQMHDEIQELINEMKEKAALHSDSVIEFKGIFNLSALNVLWVMVAGFRFRRDDARLRFLLDLIDKIFRTGNSILGTIQLPEFVTRTFPVLKKYFGTGLEYVKIIQQFLLEIVEEKEKQRSTSNPEDENDSFIDMFLSEVDRRKGDSTFSREQLIMTISDLFNAGIETTANSIGFALLHLIHYPEIQEKVQAELDDVCGDRLPSLADKPRLRYTEAVLMESQRLSNIAPTVVPHLATADADFRGHIIPKGSIVSANLYSVHMDPTYWDDPEVFRPERHLTPDGNIKKSDHLLPFGAGKRMCMGESLAKHIYFVFTTALVKAFYFKPEPNQQPPTLEPRSGFTLAYEGFKAVVIPRT